MPTWKKDKSTIVLLLLSLGLAIMLLLQQTGHLGPVYDLVGSVVIPAQYAVSRAVNGVAQRFEGLTQMQQLEAQKRELEETVSQLMLKTVELEEAKIELERLREHLGFKEANPEFDMLAAEVIGYEPTNLVRYLIIDRGEDDGVQEGMPVISSRGLVGRISEVNARWSKVLLLVDASSSVNAMIQRSRATGVVQGHLPSDLTMRFIPQGDPVQEGDIVITSGLGGNLPKNLVIGQITSVRQNDVDMFQEAEIRSAVDFYRLEVVLVIRNFTPIDFADQ
ncbi:MAG: rod shape-determining protein MreC [Chloroflexi bacterium]|nr:rod shape-determining protein MreC [Chloroflexota bacterium]